MERKSRFFTSSVLAFASLCLSSQVYAANISMNTARMQALDKVTGQMSVIDVPVNGEVKFWSFSIVVRSCQTTPPEETPENYAFVDVADTNREGQTFNIFKGWMVSSSPSLNSVEHPIYDVWLLKCLNVDGAEKKALSAEQLQERDNLERLKEEDISKEAKLAQKVQEEQAIKEEIAKAEQEEKDKKEQEADEEKARQQAIEDEIETSQEINIESISETVSEDEGPVSLLNFNDNSPSETPVSETNLLKDIPQDAPIIIETTETVETVAPATENPSVDGLVIIEDTHHEIVQELDLPSDIEQVLPQNMN